MRALLLHEVRNVAADPRTHFEIDPAAHFRLARSLRGTGREIVGCYHSHPDALAEPSATDRAGAAEEGFFWLIAGGNPQSWFTLKAYVFTDGDFRSVVIEDR